MSFFVIVGPKCTLAASQSAPGEFRYGEYTDGTDGRTGGRTPYRYIMLSARLGQRNNKFRAN